MDAVLTERRRRRLSVRRAQPARALAVSLALAATVACDDEPRSATEGEGREATEAAVAPPRYWLRYTNVLDAPGGEVVRAVLDPVLVELHEGGRVRSVPGARVVFDGYLPKEVTDQPVDREGLMLHAQRTSELRTAPIDGSVIGRVHPGAFLSVVPHGDRHYRVAVPRYRVVDSPGGLMGGQEPLRAFVERDALGPEPRIEVPPKLEGTLHRDFHAPISFGAGPETSLVCGEYLASEGRLTQYHAGIEISGVGEPPANEFDRYLRLNRCPPRHIERGPAGFVMRDGRDGLDARMIPAIPSGYLPVRLPAADPLEEVIRRRGAVHWLVTTARGLACHAWRFRPEPGKPGDPILRGRLDRQRDPRRATFAMGYAPAAGPAEVGKLTLFGPQFVGGGWKCGDVFELLGAEDDVLYVDHPHATHNRRGPLPRLLDDGTYQVAAFLPGEVEQWFLTADACEAARRRATDAMAKDPAAVDRSGLHFDCYHELHE